MFGTKKKWLELQEAVRQDDAAKVTDIVQHLRIRDKEGYHLACNTAVEHGASRALEALLDTGSFNFHPTNCDIEKQYVRELIKAASASSAALPLLTVLEEQNAAADSRHKLERTEFLNQDTPAEFIQTCLEKYPSLFENCVKNIGMDSTEKLKFILTFTSRSTNPQPVLDTALVRASETGDIEKAKLLLERQASPDYACGQSLLRAAIGGHKDIVTLLLPLMRLDLYGGDIATKLEQNKAANPAIIASIKAATRRATTAPKQETEDGYTRVDDDTLSGVQALADGSTLTTLFNFCSQQQQLILKTPENTTTLVVVSFDEIKKEVVEDMRKKLETLNRKAAPARIHL